MSIGWSYWLWVILTEGTTMTAADFLAKTHGAFTCLALVKPNSNLASEWKLEKPGYGIFEFDPAFAEVTLRWGDGSWQRIIDKKALDDLVMLEQFDDDAVSKLFDA